MIEKLLKEAIRRKNRNEIVVLSYVKEELDELLNGNNINCPYPVLEGIAINSVKNKLMEEKDDLLGVLLYMFPNKD